MPKSPCFDFLSKPPKIAAAAEVLLHQLRQDVFRVHAKRTSQVNEFDHIDPPLTTFDPGNGRLRGLEAAGELSLRESGGFPGGQQGRA
jgi:hypothetical protein